MGHAHILGQLPNIRVIPVPSPFLLADAHSPLGRFLQLLGHPSLVGPGREKSILKAKGGALQKGHHSLNRSF